MIRAMERRLTFCHRIRPGECYDDFFEVSSRHPRSPFGPPAAYEVRPLFGFQKEPAPVLKVPIGDSEVASAFKSVPLNEEAKCSVAIQDFSLTKEPHLMLQITNDYEGGCDVIYDTFQYYRGGLDVQHDFEWKRVDTGEILPRPPQPPNMPAKMFVSTLR